MEETAMMSLARMQVLQRVQEARKRYPGASRFEFRSTRNGWAITPCYGGGKIESWREQQRVLEQQLLSSQLAAISRSL